MFFLRRQDAVVPIRRIAGLGFMLKTAACIVKAEIACCR
jgi:hypothetical protein